jgi:hypothetical protein
MSRIKSVMADFDYYFDNNHGNVVIGNYTFSASEVLKEFDPIAYNEEFNNWLDTQEVYNG